MSNEPNRVGDYEVLNSLGAGGMGQVYRVRNVISDRIEAMKILLPSLSEHRDVGERFLREIKLVASLHHPNIANLCTAMAINNQLVMVMEYVDGHAFSDLLSHGPVPTRNALNYFDQALSALGYAHGKGIVHRDLKPSNIMLTQDGVVKLMDFGIARSAADRALTQTGGTIGTVSYMSPEQIAGKTTDARSDLYSMGIFFYETITGVQPFKGDSDYELMVAHMQQTPRRPIEIVAGVPAALNEIIMKLLNKAPDERFQSADEVRAALHAVEGFDGRPAAFERPAKTVAISSSAAQRQPTVVERFATPRPPTVVEQPLTGLLVRDSSNERRMTEVAGVPTYNPPAPVSLAVQKKGFARHPALYVGGGLAFTASAIALPIIYTSRHHDDKKPTTPVLTEGTSSPSGSGGKGTGPNPPGPVVAPAPNHPSGGEARKGAPPKPVVQPRPADPNAGAQRTTVIFGAQANVAPAPVTPSPAPVSPELKAQLEQEEVHIDALSSRAAAANNSLGTMQKSMAKDGVSLRGDMVAKQSSMNNNLAKAKQALASNDASRAAKFASLAEGDLGQLESFLGR